MALMLRRNRERYDEERYGNQYKAQVARDKIRQSAQVDTPREHTPVLIGRKVLLQTTHPRKIAHEPKAQHPLEKFVYDIEKDPQNEPLGTIVSPIDLVLRLVTDAKFSERYDMMVRERNYSNQGARLREKNTRALKKEIQEVFHEQDSKEVAHVVALEKVRKPKRRILTMFEDDIELIDYDTEIKDEDRLGYYGQRGPALLKVRKKITTPEDPGKTLVMNLAPLDEADLNRVVNDDLGRINASFRAVGLVGKNLPPIFLDDLALDIPFFELTDRDKSEGGRTNPTLPIVPAGLISVEPLEIYENI